MRLFVKAGLGIIVLMYVSTMVISAMIGMFAIGDFFEVEGWRQFFIRNQEDRTPVRPLVTQEPSGTASFSLKPRSVSIPKDWDLATDEQCLDARLLTFSPDGQSYAFLVANDEYVFVDGVGYHLPGTIFSLHFLPESQDLAFVTETIARKREDRRLIVGTKKRGDNLKFSEPLLPGTKQFAYAGHLPLNVSELFGLVDLGATQRGTSATSPDKTLLAERFPSRRCSTLNEGVCEWTVGVQDQAGKGVFRKSHERDISNLTFSPDSRFLAYVEGAATHYYQFSNCAGAYVYIGNTRGEKYDAIAHGSIRFSEDGKYVGYGAVKGKELRWVVEEVPEEAALRQQ